MVCLITAACLVGLEGLDDGGPHQFVDPPVPLEVVVVVAERLCEKEDGAEKRKKKVRSE